jgi:hypothetical protein
MYGFDAAAVVKAGYLLKRPVSSSSGSLKRRYIVLRPARIEWHVSATLMHGNPPLGTLPLSGSATAIIASGNPDVLHVTSGELKLRLVVDSPESLSCEPAQTLGAWAQAIQGAIRGDAAPGLALDRWGENSAGAGPLVHARGVPSSCMLFEVTVPPRAFGGQQFMVRLPNKHYDVLCCAMLRCAALRYAMRCDAMRCDAMRCDAMRCDAMRCDAMRCDAMLLLAAALCCAMLGAAAQRARRPVHRARVCRAGRHTAHAHHVGGGRRHRR